ncbi:MAG TPA: urea carboxylase-associated family protein, partial [Candidatus Angelobacter sp.]|nr:urea carboxylase-associated family protein [Candidatus Angelobacter sp.]
MTDKATSLRNTLKAKMEHLIPARTGFAFTVDAGDYIEVVDVEGRQTADFWTFHQNDLNEYLSAPHTRIGLMHMFPAPGEAFFSNHRRPIIRVVEDPVPVHDFLSAACDPWRYEELGHKGWHASCQENLEVAMKRAGYGRVTTPQPFNIWTNFHLNPDGTFEIRAPATNAGDYILLRAEMPAIIAISACPQDITQTAGGNPTDVRVRVLR